VQRDTNDRVCSGELWVERLTNDDGLKGLPEAPPIAFGTDASGANLPLMAYPKAMALGS
jgi:hypothetical protein